MPGWILMFDRRRQLLTTVLVMAALGALQAGAPQQAAEFERKVLMIAGNGVTAAPAEPLRTAISELEVNAWFASRGGEFLPQGVRAPALTLQGGNRVSGVAVVDLDAIARDRSSGGLLDPWNYLGGRVPVTVAGVVHTRGGRGRFELQEAAISGVPVPRAVIQEVVAYYSRSDSHPRGVRLDDEFTLPAQIRHLEVGRGQLVVVQ
jgi:hypothetical protein